MLTYLTGWDNLCVVVKTHGTSTISRSNLLEILEDTYTGRVNGVFEPVDGSFEWEDEVLEPVDCNLKWEEGALEPVDGAFEWDDGVLEPVDCDLELEESALA